MGDHTYVEKPWDAVNEDDSGAALEPPPSSSSGSSGDARCHFLMEQSDTGGTGGESITAEQFARALLVYRALHKDRMMEMLPPEMHLASYTAKDNYYRKVCRQELSMLPIEVQLQMCNKYQRSHALVGKGGHFVSPLKQFFDELDPDGLWIARGSNKCDKGEKRKLAELQEIGTRARQQRRKK